MRRHIYYVWLKKVSGASSHMVTEMYSATMEVCGATGPEVWYYQLYGDGSGWSCQKVC